MEDRRHGSVCLTIWFGFLESPKMKGIGILGCTPIQIPNHRAPNQQLIIIVKFRDSIKLTYPKPNFLTFWAIHKMVPPKKITFYFQGVLER